MGVKGLLQCFQNATQNGSIGSFNGTRVAIDASGWLHKGLYTAAEDYVDSGFNDYQFYVDYIMTRTRSLREAGVEPILVFDGKRNNLKSETQAKREDSRVGYIEQGRRLMESIQATGDSACRQKLRLEAISSFQKGLGVTHEMELNTISALRKLGIEVIVSPYEADAQLAHLCQIGYCDSVLTEDSDILVYSAICGMPFNVFYKFDRAGSVQVINLGEIQLIGPNSNSDSSIPDVSFCDFDSVSTKSGKQGKEKEKEKDKEAKGFLAALKHLKGPSGRRMFAQICILAGCDYSESVYGVGLIAAQRAVIRFKDCPDDERLEKVCSHFRSSGKTVSDDYLARALRAEILFHYHPVYNPVTKTVEPFMPHNIASMDTRKSQRCLASAKVRNFSSEDWNVGWSGPHISDDELVKLGSEAELLRAAPAGVSMADICEGRHSYKSFQAISLCFPWDDPKLSRPASGRTSGSHWSTRRGLIQATSGLSQSHATGRPQSVGVRPQQLPSTNWNRAQNNIQFARHQPYSQPVRQPPRPAAFSSLSALTGAASQNPTGALRERPDSGVQAAKNQSWAKSNPSRSGDRDSKSIPHQSQRDSMMVSSFNLPAKSMCASSGASSLMDDGDVEVINPRLPVQLLQHPPYRPGVVDNSVARSAVLPASLQMTPPIAHCNPSSTCGEFDFYSQTETDSEDCFLDLSSSPGKSSEGSDDGTEGDSPGSQAEHSTALGSSDVSFIGGIAECGSGSGQAFSSEAAIMAECMGRGIGSKKAPSSSRLPPSSSSSTSSSLFLAQPITDENIKAVNASGKRSLDGKSFGDSRDTNSLGRTLADNASSPTDSICNRVASLDCSSHSVSSNRSGSSVAPSPSNIFVNRGKENIINISMDTSAETGGTPDLSVKCVSMSNCAALASKAVSGTRTLGDSYMSNSSAVQGVKRKQYDTVAIVSDSKGGKNKRPKSTMRVASIMSFFTPS